MSNLVSVGSNILPHSLGTLQVQSPKSRELNTQHKHLSAPCDSGATSPEHDNNARHTGHPCMPTLKNPNRLQANRKRHYKSYSIVIALHPTLPTIGVRVMSPIPIRVSVEGKLELLSIHPTRCERCTHARDSGSGAPIRRRGIGVVEVLELGILDCLFLQFRNACSLYSH